MPRQALSPPDLQTIGGRLRWARELAHYTSARSAAQAFGWNENTYKSHEMGLRGRDGIKSKTAEKYARAFHISVEWLLAGTGVPQDNDSDRQWRRMSDEERALALRLLRAATPQK